MMSVIIISPVGRFGPHKSWKIKTLDDIIEDAKVRSQLTGGTTGTGSGTGDDVPGDMTGRTYGGTQQFDDYSIGA